MFWIATLVTLLPDAEARHIGLLPFVTDKAKRIAAFVPGDGTVASLTATVESGAGSEEIELEESDAWMHGTAAIKALPKADATVELTLYDAGSVALAGFSGTLAADGSIELRRGVGFCSCDPGYAGSCDKGEVCTDLDLLAAELFVAASGYELGIDLTGADTYDVAYATVVVTEGRATTTKAEVGWDEIGAVWEGELSLDHAGEIAVKAKTYDRDGEKIESTKASLGGVWEDGGYGVGTLAIDDDPLTRVALGGKCRCLPGFKGPEAAETFTIVSTGWPLADSLPASATVELDGGETLVIPVNSYQVAAAPFLEKLGDGVWYTIAVDGTTIVSAQEFISEPVCSGGYCVLFTDEEDGTYSVSVTAYANDAGKLPATTKIELTTFDKSGGKLGSDSGTIIFDGDVAVVFANEVTLAGDPIDVDLSGKVSLLASPTKKGKTKTLAKGKFYGTLGRDLDGDLNLRGADKDTIDAKGDILIGGEPIDFELTDMDKDGYLDAPPVMIHEDGEGLEHVTMVQIRL